MLAAQALPLLLSAVTIVGMWKVGEKKSVGWTIGLANQALWAVFIVAFEAWGLVPLCAALVFVYSRNLLRWRAASETS